MKTIIFPVALLLGYLTTINAQGFNLPVSTKSETALKAYQAATYLGSNIRFDAARMEIKKAFEADPNFFMAYVYDYQVLANNEQKPALLDKALAIDPSRFNEAEKIMRRQMAEWKADPKAKPTETMKALVAAYPKTPEAYEWAYLHAWYTDGNKEAALGYAQKLAALDPNFGPVFNSLGYFYMEKKEMDKAKAAFEKYIKIAPAEPNAYDSMGEYYLNTGDFNKSAELYDRAVALGMEGSKDGAEKAREQQRIYLPVTSTSEAAKFDYFKALKAGENANIPAFFDGMKAAVKTDANFFMAYVNLALAETAFGQYEKAAAYIKPALAIDPKGFNKGEQIYRKALQVLEKDPKANPAEYMEALIAAYPKTAEAHDVAGRSAKWISKDAKASVKHTLRSLELRPGFGGGYNALGYSYMELGEMAKAKAAFEKYIELSPKEPNAYDSMGEYYLNNKEYAKSVEYYNKAAVMGMGSSMAGADKARAAMKGNVAVVDGLYQAFAKGDVPAVLAVMDANIVWNEAEGFPYADQNPYKGPDAVVNGVFARIGAEWEYWNLTDIQLHDMSGNKVLATLRYKAKHKTTGKVIDSQTAHLWSLRDGKITAFQQFTDTKQAAGAVK